MTEPLILGIETSCDETAVALVRGGRLLGQRLASQVDAHALFGGVVPELASREHLRVLPELLRLLLDDTGLTASRIDAVAVARGPGLLGCLLVGVSFAKGLCLATGADLVGVNHLFAHLLAAGLERDIPVPACGLLVSGGHTHLYRILGPARMELLGRTLDDAAGEAFDKVAKKLNLPYPGGRFIDEIGAGGEVDDGLFPKPYLDNDNLDFSFSGLKTAVSQYVDANPGLALPALDLSGGLPDPLPAGLARVCASFNHAVAQTLLVKTARALDAMPEARSLVVAGGVAANSAVRAVMAGLAGERGLPLVLPSPALCTDNAAMIARAGELIHAQGLRHGLELEAVPRGRAVPDDWMRA